MVSAQSSIQGNSTDVIVVGAGSSRPAVVRRLVDAGLWVTVLEAGPRCLKSYSEGVARGEASDVLRCTARTRINVIVVVHWEQNARRDDVERVFSPPAVTGAGSSS